MPDPAQNGSLGERICQCQRKITCPRIGVFDELRENLLFFLMASHSHISPGYTHRVLGTSRLGSAMSSRINQPHRTSLKVRKCIKSEQRMEGGKAQARLQGNNSLHLRYGRRPWNSARVSVSLKGRRGSRRWRASGVMGHLSADRRMALAAPKRPRPMNQHWLRSGDASSGSRPRTA
jgi:hypothetical protein